MIRARAFAIGAALVLLSAMCCFAQAAGSKKNPKLSRMSEATKIEAALPADVQDRLITKEKDLFAAQQRQNLAAVEESLADDFHEIGSTGKLYSKTEVLDALKDMRMVDHSLSDFKVLPLDSSSAVVTYKADITRTSGGQQTSIHSYRSSLWVKRSGSWRVVFHQSTPLPDKQ